ncbi:SMC-Scp complex subunit ScpB [Candidatus Woesearchaeota archaeon]|nr:SMC-Scp complex subunit ScpB [Candidatus Woesearchaeota archaeon]
MDEKIKKVEAVLFTVGKEITSERIASLCSLSVPEVEKVMLQLQQEYAQRDHSLKLEQRENGWKLTVRDEYVPLVSSIVESTEMEGAMMQTLAVIAWKYPIIQSEIIKLRGSSAYEHMRLLEEQGFIAKEKFQRTFKVKLTPKFFEYFDLPSAEAKQAFLQRVPAKVLEEAESVNQEANEVERLVEQEQTEKKAREEIKKAVDGVRKN